MAKIILYCSDVVGKSMSGPAIRYWEFANILCKEHAVHLLSPNQSDLTPSCFTLTSYGKHFPLHMLQQADILITQMVTPAMAYAAKKNRVKIILDAYDPIPLEHLEIYKHYPLGQRHERNIRTILDLEFWFKMADGVICASEKQRDLWMGLLMAQKRITPKLYDQDKSMRHLIDVVPFGLSSQRPKKTGQGLRDRYGFMETDKIILWGGGIWNWFDPLSLIKAIKILSQQRTDIKLVFMGVSHPNPAIPRMEMCTAAIEEAKKSGLLDKQVFFNYGWVPYEERENFLLDADIGVSTHLEHLETRYSFRTRMLDYIWAGLPILATEGDSFAELIDSRNLGAVVPYQDEQAIAQKIVELVDNPQKIAAIKTNLEALRQQFMWEEVTTPLQSMIHYLVNEPSQASFTYRQARVLLNSFIKQKTSVVREKGVWQTIKGMPRYLNKLLRK